MTTKLEELDNEIKAAQAAADGLQAKLHTGYSKRHELGPRLRQGDAGAASELLALDVSLPVLETKAAKARFRLEDLQEKRRDCERETHNIGVYIGRLEAEARDLDQRREHFMREVRICEASAQQKRAEIERLRQRRAALAPVPDR
jgi:chromosome segregation ATPase